MGSSRLNRRRFVQISAALSAGFALTACTGSTGEEPAPAVEVTEEPRVFRFAQAAPSLHLDPARTQRLESTRITAQVLEPAVRADSNTGEPAPSLVSSWELDADALEYTLTLEEGVVFSDGSAFTSRVLAQNFDRWKTLSQQPLTRLTQPYHQLFAAADTEDSEYASALVESWSTPDEQTLTLRLSRSSVSFLKALTQPSFGVILPEHLDERGYLTETPVGTGAFRVQSWDGAQAHLVANENYRGAAPELDVLEFVTLPDAEKRYYSLLQGEVEAYDQVALKDYVPLALDGYAVQSRDPYAISYVGVNMAHPAFADALTRRALARAIDRGKISGDYYPQGSATANDFLPALFQMKNEDARNHYRYDMAAAKSLLEASTYANQPIDFYYPVQVSLASLPSPEGIYSVISANLTEAGFNIVPKPYRWDEEGSEDIPTSHPDYGLELTGFMGAFRDPSAFLGRVLAPSHGAPAELTGTEQVADESPEASPSPSRSSAAQEQLPTQVPQSFTSLLQEIRAADTVEDIEARRAAYRQINAGVAEFLPAVPLTYPVSGVTQSKRVRGYAVNATGIDRFSDVSVGD